MTAYLKHNLNDLAQKCVCISRRSSLITFQIPIIGLGEMVQWVRALALPENLGLILSIYGSPQPS